LRALTLSSKFMNLYTQKYKQRKGEDGNPIIRREDFVSMGVGCNYIFDEIPIKVYSSPLLHGLLYESRCHAVLSNNTDRLDLSSTSLLKKSLKKMEDGIEELVQEQSTYVFHQRKLARLAQDKEAYEQRKKSSGEIVDEAEMNRIFKDIPTPSRLNAYVITNQLTEGVQHINDLCNQQFCKLYTMQGLYNSTLEQV